MSLHSELLDVSRYLLRRNQNRPTQADLRRSISTAYYALFHRLIDDAVSRLVDGATQRDAYARAFDHNEMREACKRVGQPSKDFAPMGGLEVAPEISRVAKLFIDLQQVRHDADYNRGRLFEKSEAKELVEQLELALEGWDRVRATPAAQSFLVLLLLGKRVNR